MCVCVSAHFVILINKIITAFSKVFFYAFEFVELAVRLVGVIKLDSLES